MSYFPIYKLLGVRTAASGLARAIALEYAIAYGTDVAELSKSFIDQFEIGILTTGDLQWESAVLEALRCMSPMQGNSHYADSLLQF